jgi:DNA-binding NarL/FixJ family response regulator
LSPYSIVLVDDHLLFRKGIEKIIAEIDGLEVVGEASDGLELLKLLEEIRPDLIILDISMPNLRGLEATREIKKTYRDIKILILSMHKKKEFVQQALKAGAEGFLLKQDADCELLKAIKVIREGGKYISPLLSSQMADLVLLETPARSLTNREREVLKLYAEGKSSQEIAGLLFISIFTVRRHRDNIMKKLNFRNTAEMVRYALQAGLTSEDL